MISVVKFLPWPSTVQSLGNVSSGLEIIRYLLHTIFSQLQQLLFTSMERLTARNLANLPQTKSFAITEWIGKRERHEEFAVVGRTNIVQLNVKASQNVLKSLRNLS